MNSPKSAQSVFRWIRQKPLIFGLILLAVVAGIAALIKSSQPPPQESSYYEVKRGDFLISIVEGGNIQAVNEVAVRSEVEGTARIIFIVPEGSTVKKGQLVVELDSSAATDAVSQQQINVEKAQFALIQAEQQLAIQKSTVDSEVSAAKLKVEFAQSDLDKYVKGELEQTRRNAQIEITNVVENLQIAEERLEWSVKLEKNGYETKANLDKDRLAVSQTKLKLEQALKALELLEIFDFPKKKRALEAALQEATENLDRVNLQGERKLAQYAADLDTQKKTLDLSVTKLERDKKQLMSAKIYAPQDGLVVYGGGGDDHRFSSESMIEEGAVVRNRQEIIKLPDVSAMKLTVKIHESHINQIRLGQPAYVVFDSMPDRRFQGVVNKVAPLPDNQSRFGNPNLKVYATEILINDKLPNIKPGISARAEVVITNLQKVLTVPIQAVTTRKGKQVVYLSGSPPQNTPVTVGMYNVKFIEILSGLKEGDRVLLSPPLDTQEKDLAGAIIAEGDNMPVTSGTNRPARPSRGARDGGTSFDAQPSGNGTDRSSANPSALGGGPVPKARSGMGRESTPGMENAGSSDGGGARGPGSGRNAGARGGVGSRAITPEMLKQFDANGDGRLDETERAAMIEQFGRGRRPGASTNSTADQPSKSPDANR